MPISKVSQAGLSSGAQFNGFKNRIINGAMVIAQRATSAALPINDSSTYTTLDRFCSYGNTGQTGTSSRVTSDLAGFPYALKLQRTQGITSTSNIQFGQAIETLNSIDLAGQNVTFSFYAKAGANFSASGSNVFVQLATGTGTDQSFSNMTGGLWTGQNNLLSFVTQSITTTWTRYTWTVSVPSTATQMGFQVIWAPTGTAGADDALYITGVQLEKGSTATSFDYRPYGIEFDLCRRYCEVYTNTNCDNVPATIAQTDVNNRPEMNINYYTKRSAPSITVSTNNLQFNTLSNANIAVTGYAGALVGTTVNGANMFFTTASGVTAGALSGAGVFQFTGTCAITISAEL